MPPLPALLLHRAELDALGEYSCSYPSGTTVGKVWARRSPGDAQAADADWYIGMYVPDEDPQQVGIVWFQVVLLEGPPPPGWRTPDWWTCYRALHRGA